MDIELMDHQIDAIEFLGNGKILYGEVGVGKSATALAYYVNSECPRNIYVITTAKKRDSLDWEGEAAKFGIGREFSVPDLGTITIDSWNNIGKYVGVQDAFFIFDEQRLIGTGAWVKYFLKISKHNRWILLSATPGDVWLDYAPVFVANGWYKSISEFKREHVIYAPYVKFPKVLRYVGIRKLEALRNELLVEMPYPKNTKRHLNYLPVSYDMSAFDDIIKKRWHPFEHRPIRDASEMFRLMRMVNNMDPSRLHTIMGLMQTHPKLIIFYNFNYELEILQSLIMECDVAEWNGHKKQQVPKSSQWVYLVQYNAGAEGWNCTETDSMILYSLTYSYKNFIQSQGRIDRINTAFIDLYYYILVSGSPIDKAVKYALDQKRSFNEREMAKTWENTAFI